MKEKVSHVPFLYPHTNYNECDRNHTVKQGRYVRTYECRCPPYHDKAEFRKLYKLLEKLI